MQIEKLSSKFANDINKLVKSALLFKFEEVVPKIQEAILAKYDEELVDVVTDRNSKTNPNFYREDFSERLSEFSYIKDNGNVVTLVVPDIDNFKFSGRLRVIETIMHGLAGAFVEVNGEDYMKIKGKKVINQDPLDEYVSPKEMIYLVPDKPDIKKAAMDLNKKFAPYPFSNTPPIEIFSSGQKFVDENMDRWIKEAVDKAQNTFAANYRGAKL
jgi:hypothetical protein